MSCEEHANFNVFGLYLRASYNILCKFSSIIHSTSCNSIRFNDEIHFWASEQHNGALVSLHGVRNAQKIAHTQKKKRKQNRLCSTARAAYRETRNRTRFHPLSYAYRFVILLYSFLTRRTTAKRIIYCDFAAEHDAFARDDDNAIFVWQIFYVIDISILCKYFRIVRRSLSVPLAAHTLLSSDIWLMINGEGHRIWCAYGKAKS